MSGVDKTMNPAAAQDTPTFESLGLSRPKEGLKDKNLGQDEFLSLMVAQMSNQDPMKPMENGEFISQMAQFSAAKGMKEIKDSFATLAEALQSSQALQASSMVGRQVMVEGGVAALPEDGELTASVELKRTAPELAISIMDDAGQLLKRMSLGRQEAGKVSFKWDGEVDRGSSVEGSQTEKASPGRYKIKAEVIVDGKPEVVSTFVFDKVESVSLGKGAQGVTLNLVDSGKTTLSNVKEVM